MIVRVIVDGVLGVTVDVHIGHDEVLVIYVAIFVVIFCNWRCTLYSSEEKRAHRAQSGVDPHRVNQSIADGTNEEVVKQNLLRPRRDC